MNDPSPRGRLTWLRGFLAGLSLLLGLSGMVLAAYGWFYPAVDVGVIIRGVLIVGGLGIAAAALVPLAILAMVRRRSWDSPSP